jgi:hypothetical protein
MTARRPAIAISRSRQLPPESDEPAAFVSVAGGVTRGVAVAASTPPGVLVGVRVGVALADALLDADGATLALGLALPLGATLALGEALPLGATLALGLALPLGATLPLGAALPLGDALGELSVWTTAAAPVASVGLAAGPRIARPSSPVTASHPTVRSVRDLVLGNIR